MLAHYIYFRPLLYIAARKHNAYDRDIDKITRFIVFMLVSLYIKRITLLIILEKYSNNIHQKIKFYLDLSISKSFIKHKEHCPLFNTCNKKLCNVQEQVCRKCDEDVIDNLCIVFDLKDFSMANMDYQFVKNLVWLLSKYYPERLGVCLIINAPMIFYGCWPVIRAL